MVKYRQATQKPSNVCFTGRGRMERVKNSHWVSVFAHNSQGGWITPPLFKQSDNLLNSSDGHKVLLRKPSGWAGEGGGMLVPALLPTTTPPHLCLRGSREQKELEKFVRLHFAGGEVEGGEMVGGDDGCFKQPEPETEPVKKSWK